MSATVQGLRATWGGDRDQEGHRTYHVVHIVRALRSDGPYVVMQASGLPVVGSSWAFGNDFDPWAFCTPEMRVSIHKEKEGDFSSRTNSLQYWRVRQTFTTKPLNRCQDESIEDPLLEPPRYGGSFVKYVKEVQKDKDGNAILTSSRELVKGSLVEFDHNRPTVWVEMNSASLGLSTFAAMVDNVNDGAMWGLSARCVKLSNVTWERKIYGTCDFYYTRRFDFDIRYDTFDTSPIDSGVKAFGHWDPEDKDTWTTTDHLLAYKDKQGNYGRVMLNGAGIPIADDADPVNIPGAPVEYYPETNFFILGIPASF